MKEVKAYVHRNLVADVVVALRTAGFERISFAEVKGVLKAMDALEREFSTELGQEVISEVKVEVVCADEEVPKVVELIRQKARTGQSVAGWVFVMPVLEAHRIGAESDR